MTKKKSARTVERGFLKVYRSMWKEPGIFIKSRGKKHEFKTLELARAYAHEHGYAGIKVEHVNE